MSDENRAQGKYFYACGDKETKDWFEKQWKIWPERANQKLTTNISFHHGGVLAYREEHGKDPEMSPEFKPQVEWLDKFEKKAEANDKRADDSK